MNFTDIVLVMAKALESVHKDERDALINSLLYAFGDVGQLTELEHNIIVNTVDSCGGDEIEALTELLNEDVD